MTRADTEQIKVHYKGNEDDFIVMAESVEAVKRWKEDKSTPLVDVVNSFDVFTTHKYVPPSISSFHACNELGKLHLSLSSCMILSLSLFLVHLELDGNLMDEAAKVCTT
jgi:hypothetical protein